jgi:hypothetical protein
MKIQKTRKQGIVMKMDMRKWIYEIEESDERLAMPIMT